MQASTPNSNGSVAYTTYTYDSTTGGNQGIGRRTGENFTSNGVSGSYAWVYDGRGRQSRWTMTIGGTSYPFNTLFNDADQPTQLTYPDGSQLATNYGAQDWLSGVNVTRGGTTTTLLNSLSYTGVGGASQQITGGQVANGTYTWSQGYDAVARLTQRTVTAGGTTRFDQTRRFDNAGNVQFVDSTLPAGTDHQGFCYDQSDRMYWAGNNGTPGCGISFTAGTLTSAFYTLNASYDQLDRMTQGPAGSSYTYGDSAHLSAATRTGNGYTAAYDAAGGLTCRALGGSGTTCAGTPTGQTLSYDNLRRQLRWQNTATAPTSTANYVYDGEGERVQQAVTTSGTTTTTRYIGAYEELATTGGTTTTTVYYDGTLTTLVSVNGTFAYLVRDGLATVTLALNTSGAATAVALDAPYGTARYTVGTMPTSYGFTGQRQDPSGLNYAHARYYDPTLGQFTSPDAIEGLNRYAYVHGNPVTLTDPTGQCPWCITILVGAVIGAAISAGTSVVQQASSGKPINWGEVGKQAVVGAVTGAITGLVGPEGGPLAMAAIGALSGAAGQATSNALEGKPLTEGLAQAALLGGAGGAAGALGGKLLSGGAKALSKALGKAEKEAVAATEREGNTILESAAKDPKEVILDTNAVYGHAKAHSILSPGEKMVITQQVREELEANLSKKGLSIPIAVLDGTIPVVADDATPGTLSKLSLLSKYGGAFSKPIGREGDMIIAADAIDSGRPVITGDQELYNFLRDYGHDVRKLLP